MKTKETKKAPEFVLSGKINGTYFSVGTDDIKKTIKEIAPAIVLTESYITLTKGAIESQQRLNLIRSKRVFRDETSLEIFVNNLLVPFR